MRILGGIRHAEDHVPRNSVPPVLHAGRGKAMLANNKVFFLPTGILYLLGVLNSPLMWWYAWRYLPHMKDEALSPVAFKMETLPIAGQPKRYAPRSNRIVEF